MGRLPENYVGPKYRIEMLKKDFGHKAAILTEAKMIQVGETLCVMFVATIKIDGETVANGHAFTDTPEENKAVEKAETIAIGRALVNAGYPELDDGSLEERESEKPNVESIRVKKQKENGGEKNVSITETSGNAEPDKPVRESTQVVLSEDSKPKRSGSGGIPKGFGTKRSVPALSKQEPEKANVQSEQNEEIGDGDNETVAATSTPKEDVVVVTTAKPEEAPKRLSAAELLAKYKK